ncbi:hypothetical protein OVA14_10545 [Agrococcus sp. SL85]|uniref:hypothetical protein n=1 Tax=Agrococcus sp. SL85 TaxID=2995141 RepID=UPI00226CDCC9|nr:hypothetical protein [Agrococcus sp. SL85]WAC65756.1 hypothetical protein OVA14_10545 [Agrococcus sp. SL85]
MSVEGVGYRVGPRGESQPVVQYSDALIPPVPERSAPGALLGPGAIVTSRHLSGRGSFVLQGFERDGELRRAVLVPLGVAAELAPGVEAPAEHRHLVAPTSLEPSPWAVVPTAKGSNRGGALARQQTA